MSWCSKGSTWEASEYADETYVDNPLTDEKVKAVEAELGYTLPSAYVELMRSRNGGIPKKTNHRSPRITLRSAGSALRVV
ncbi:hypothetical protein D3C83_55940 [compost metagenome]